MLNFSKDSADFGLPPHVPVATKELLISNYPVDSAEAIHKLRLRPFEARVYQLR